MTDILLTAFRGTSSEKLIRQIDSSKYKKVLLPNNKEKDSEIVDKMISDGKYKYVICLGQKPIMKDKVAIETTAKCRDISINTSFQYIELKNILEENGIEVKISHNAGTSYCNCLYYNCMMHLKQKELNTKVIFIHIPMLKNITDSVFFPKLIHVLNELEKIDIGT